MIWSQVHAPKRACMCYGSAYSAVAAQIAALRVFILGLLRRCLRHAPRACGCSLSKLGSQKPNMSSKVQSENANTLKVASAVVLQALTPMRSISGHAQCYAPTSTSSPHKFSKFEHPKPPKFLGGVTPPNPLPQTPSQVRWLP